MKKELVLDSVFRSASEKQWLLYLRQHLERIGSKIEDGSSYLHKAVQQDSPLLVYFIMTHCADPETWRLRDNESHTPFDIAIAQKNIQVLALLCYFFLIHNKHETVDYFLSIFIELSSDKKMNELRRQYSDIQTLLDKQEKKIHEYLNPKSTLQLISEWAPKLFHFTREESVAPNAPNETELLLKKAQ